MTLLTITGYLALAYLAAGLLFALCFIFKGIEKVDESAAHSSAGFRIIIIPGIMVFWPLLLKMWLNATGKIKQR